MEEEDIRKIRKRDLVPFKGFFQYSIRNLREYNEESIPYHQILSITGLAIYNILLIKSVGNGLVKLIESVKQIY